MNLPHLVVLGAGFGGLSFAKEFPGELARITLVDRQNHHLFQPLLYQVASSGLAAPDIAQPIRSILRNTLLAYEKAEREPDPQRRQELMTTVVIGGGPTGVELAGSFAELARTVLYRDFDHIDPRQARIILVEGSPRLLGTFPEDLSASAKQQIEGLGVEVRLQTRVTAIREGEVEIGTEVIRAGNIVWAAGVAAVPITQTLGVPLDRAGRVQVQSDFSLPGHANVFAIGDLATLTDANGVVVPGVAQGGIQAGGTWP